MDEIEIEAFRAGTKASQGLTAEHIAKAAALYNADKAPAPLVFGHPTHDSPAIGLVSKARAEGNKLFLSVKNIAQTAIDAVRERRILNRSIAFWDPHHPSNPNPGEYSIRHLGLLGGMAPAIPGMPALKFSADDTGFDFAEGDIAPEAAIIFAAEPEGTPVSTITEPRPKESTTMTPEQIAAKEAEFAARESAIAQREEATEQAQKQFAASEKLRRETENKNTVDRAVAAGSILPAEAEDLVRIFNALPVSSLTFSTGDAEPRIALASFLDKLPKRTPVGETPISDRGATFGAGNSDAARAEAEALAKANAGLSSAWRGAQQGNA